ncbi:FmdB family transcriptional regulator [Curtobacterium sp. MCBD17_013]|nr:FmdB family transcriptional regulator [Curtobacterium sp. MCBD17_028]PZF62724.1 FmdB family transcriptional regulator [Curtobacterium sp. MCBD17_013]
MPTYSYRCTECGTAFDVKQSFSDAALTECPTCGGVLRKVFSPVGVTFNGSGFYRTDSRSSSGASGTKSESGGGSTPSESSSSSSTSSSSSGSTSSSSSGSSSTGSSSPSSSSSGSSSAA